MMRRYLILLCLLLSSTHVHATGRWTDAKANAWYRQLPWLVGVNYIPSNSINELEMWQKTTFDPARIDTELGWAEGIGMNTVRVFLHNLLWQQDEAGFKDRISRFLTIANKHHIRTIFVLFDSCWDPHPKLGPQHRPTPGVHNSGWVQSPGADVLEDPLQYWRLEVYVKGVVGAFADDRRVLAWDVWNEPNNANDDSYGALEPKNKESLVEALLPQVFAWARAAMPTQPLTSGIRQDDSLLENRASLPRIQIENSDVISFHNYAGPQEFENQIHALEEYHRPILCTEYMARSIGSTFEGVLPVAKKYKVAAINWGLVAGKTQTFLPWDSWKKPYVDRAPAVWFHDIFQADGTAYRSEETKLFRRLTKN